jgi:NAD-dependent deacetylase sirtuin 4
MQSVGARILSHLQAHGSQRVLFLTGAGVSTQSGIPCYRSPDRPVYRPLQHAEYVGSELLRQRYWARSMMGWPRMQHAVPNAAHLHLASLQRLGLCSALITQNVDTLHSKAGHAGVLELHGSLFQVECLRCAAAAPLLCRNALQARMLRENEAWRARYGSLAEERPDGDVELPSESYLSFHPPACPCCGSPSLKPTVTFFGGTIPPHIVQHSLLLAEQADAIVVAGSTCSTFSAFRLLKGLAARGRPVVVVKQGGPGRGDALATLLVEEEVGAALGSLLQEAEQAQQLQAGALGQQQQQSM